MERQRIPFVNLVAREHLSFEEVEDLLDCPAYFSLLELPRPASQDGIADALSNDLLIQECPAGGWDITNLGAILFARQLKDFPSLSRKAVRVIQYRGNNRRGSAKERISVKGYAAEFKELVSHVNELLPSNEVIGQARRRIERMYPELAVRELIANALIHQDLTATGTGPMVEIFESRIEVTNPGEPLVSTDRFVDAPPKTRNESLASLMRRFRFCEERGSGIDNVIDQVEMFQLPAPLFEAPGKFTRSTLYAHVDLKDMSQQDRIRSCYLHACLCYVDQRKMTNATLRKRFGIAEKNAARASRLLKEATEAGVIIVENPTVGARSRSYLPFWAGRQLH